MKCSKILGNDIFISEIASWTAHSRNFPKESFALPKLLDDLFESQKLQIYPFRKREGLLLPCCKSFRWCFRGWKSIQIHDLEMQGPVCSIIKKVWFLPKIIAGCPCFYLTTKSCLIWFLQNLNFPLNFALLISTSAQLFNPSSTVVNVPPKI